jgi:hypothetical protein
MEGTELTVDDARQLDILMLERLVHTERLQKLRAETALCKLQLQAAQARVTQFLTQRNLDETRLVAKDGNWFIKEKP